MAGNGHGSWSTVLSAAGDTAAIKATAQADYDDVDAAKVACEASLEACDTSSGISGTNLGESSYWDNHANARSNFQSDLDLLEAAVEDIWQTGGAHARAGVAYAVAAGYLSTGSSYQMDGADTSRTDNQRGASYDEACRRFIECGQNSCTAISDYESAKAQYDVLLTDLQSLEVAIILYRMNNP